MSSVLLYRTSKGRTFLLFALCATAVCSLFFLSNVHSRLKTSETNFEQCSQQKDSLSAQLQVIYEHKTRLEKSLKQEQEAKKKEVSELKASLQRIEEHDRQKLEKVEAELSELKDHQNDAYHDLEMRFKTLQERYDAMTAQLAEERQRLAHSEALVKQKADELIDERTRTSLQLHEVELKLRECAEHQRLHHTGNDTVSGNNKVSNDEGAQHLLAGGNALLSVSKGDTGQNPSIALPGTGVAIANANTSTTLLQNIRALNDSEGIMARNQQEGVLRLPGNNEVEVNNNSSSTTSTPSPLKHEGGVIGERGNNALEDLAHAMNVEAPLEEQHEPYQPYHHQADVAPQPQRIFGHILPRSGLQNAPNWANEPRVLRPMRQPIRDEDPHGADYPPAADAAKEDDEDEGPMKVAQPQAAPPANNHVNADFDDQDIGAEDVANANHLKPVPEGVAVAPK